MVIDTSALIAILLKESDAEQFAKAISHDSKRLLSAFSALETSIVIEARMGEVGKKELDILLDQSKIKIVDLNDQQMQIALDAWRKFGKGNHPAKLNIGDCCSYAAPKNWPTKLDIFR